MKSIYKYVIGPSNGNLSIPLPEGKTFKECIVSAKEIDSRYRHLEECGDVWIWVIIDDTQKEQNIQIVSHFTGDKICSPIEDLIPIYTKVIEYGFTWHELLVIHYFQLLNPEGCEQ